MQLISPETIYRGNYAWEKSLPQITKLTKSPLILGRGIDTYILRKKILFLRLLVLIPLPRINGLLVNLVIWDKDFSQAEFPLYIVSGEIDCIFTLNY